MAARNVTYYFGRLNIIAVYTDKRDFLLQGLQAGKIVQSSRSGWGFFEVEELRFDGERFFSGYLVRYRPEGEEEIVVHETQQIEDEAVKNRVVAKSRFFLHITSGIIAYHPVGHQISRGQFMYNFVQVFMENHERFFVSAEIQTVEEEIQIFEAIRRFNRIQEVSISLHPSNPSNRDLWERTDQRLKALKAASYQEKIEANPDADGLQLEQDMETTGKIHMAADGYGKATIRGTVDGEETKISTSDNPVTMQAPSDDTPAEDVFKTLIVTFRTIRGRFTEKDETVHVAKQEDNDKPERENAEGVPQEIRDEITDEKQKPL